MDPDQPPSEEPSEVYRETGVTVSRVFAPQMTRRIIQEFTANPWSAPSRRFAGDSQGRRIRGRFVWRGSFVGPYNNHMERRAGDLVRSWRRGARRFLKMRRNCSTGVDGVRG